MCDRTMGDYWQCLDGFNWNYVVERVPAPASCRMAPASNYYALKRAPHGGSRWAGVTVGITPQNEHIFECECGERGRYDTLAQARNAAVAHHDAEWAKNIGGAK